MNKQKLIEFAGALGVDWDLLAKECRRQDYDINELINWRRSPKELEFVIDNLIINGFHMDR